MGTRKGWYVWAVVAFALLFPAMAAASSGESPRHIDYVTAPPAPEAQMPIEAAKKSEGCLTCHTATDQHTMHVNPGVVLGCTDCHGGNAAIRKPDGGQYDRHAKGGPYREAMDTAHVLPRFPNSWHYPSSANPERTYTLLNRESPEYIRFINPGDLRIAREACGACHLPIIYAVERSMMASGAMLWGGAAYNNGILPFKRYITGEHYTREGVPAAVKSPGELTEKELKRGNLPILYPLPAWEVIPPGDVFRVFERGGRNIVTQFPEIGLPNSLGQIQRLEEPGRPDLRQSMRGPGTGLRVAIPVLNITKTRLNDPFLWFLGTNDNPGDYRHSGCSGCHVVYANDRDPRHSGPYAKFGHEGKTQTVDPTIPKDESGHPLKHEFTRAIPTSQCMICHMHQPNVFVNSFMGYTMWDYESDADSMWPKTQRYPTAEEEHKVLMRNPEEASARGLWADVDFMKRVSELNPTLRDTQFADYHGHGWNFRAIFKRDRKGNLLDKDGAKVAQDDPQKFKKAVHMSSIHVDLGMHCVDCHFAQDAHNNGYIQGEVANAIEIDCADCHGTPDKYPVLRTSGPAARPGGYDLSLLRVQDGRARFEWRTEVLADGQSHKVLYQRAALDPTKEWRMSMVKDTVDVNHPDYNPLAARAKLMSKDVSSLKWGPGIDPEQRAHKDSEMLCFTCHLSWTTSCAGCHLPIQANRKTERHHFEGGETRNFATYNPQVARDEMFQLGRHQTTKGHKYAPIRSSSALILSSKNINREIIYLQQPPIAASGYSSQAFAPHFPHTERKTETKTCTDCHLSSANDNNAIMAQLLLHGTNFVNFVGMNAWVGGDGGVEAVVVTEYEEPQAVIGSFLHKNAYPDWYKAHQDRGRELPEAHTHRGDRTGCLQMRGEYLLAAEGPDGTQAYDIASIANKGFSQRIITAPFSPLGHDTRIRSKNATCVVMPTNQPIHPARQVKDEATKKLMLETNEEQPFHPIYNYAFITDSEEGLIATDINTLFDGEPRNNFLKRQLTWNEGGVLTGARFLVIGGYYFYVLTPKGVVILNMNDPLQPKVIAQVPLDDPRGAALQFRYLFVTDKDGLKVIDVTHADRPKLVPGATVKLDDARRVYLARTFAYVAAKHQGLAIIDVEKPEQPKLFQLYTADGKLNDAHDVVVGTTNASLYAYVADGKNGLKVLQLTGPDIQPLFYGFSPDPNPHLIGWKQTRWPALSLSKGLDRDRGVDETGGQMAIFGRVGSRPFNYEEQRKFYLDRNGDPWFVYDDVRSADFVPGTKPTATAPRRPQPGGTPYDPRKDFRRRAEGVAPASGQKVN